VRALSGSASVLTLLVVILMVASGFVMALWWQDHQQRQRRKSKRVRTLPRQWPLNPRRIAGTAEREVWHWLRAVFPDHRVLVKLPVTRYTVPHDPEKAREWFGVLSGVYCTFSICTDDARVIGCVDVIGKHGISRSNRQLKQTLLAQCGIGYWVIMQGSLPNPDALRADFIGEAGIDSEPPPTEAQQLEQMRHQLHETLDRSRERRHQANRPGAGAEEEGDTVAQWRQEDSFLAPVDSRRAELRKH